jgi:UDP-glucose 4-epimerase
MHILVTGANGTIGRFIAKCMLDDGHKVTALGRQPLPDKDIKFTRFDLVERAPVLPGADVLVHCALVHVPGKFRNGEGDDPDGFWQSNVEGTGVLFEAARNVGCRQVVFLSSRAVYGDHRKGETLFESDPPTPDTLYGKVKLAGESALAELANAQFQGTVLRPTGVYGKPPGANDHKWTRLFEDFRAGTEIEPRVATEVHGEDVASAVKLVIDQADRLEAFDVFNVSDVLVDRREILGNLKWGSKLAGNLPQHSEARPSQMDTSKLRALGWLPGGLEKLKNFVASF